MAAGSLPKPGTYYGPCVEPCNHLDCNKTRKQAQSICCHCGKPIGYDTPFYDVRNCDDRSSDYVHALCEEQFVLEGRKDFKDQKIV